MKKLLLFAVTAVLMGATAPLTPVQAVPTGITSRTAIAYTYENGFNMGHRYISQCPTPSESQWEQRRATVLQNSYNAFQAGRRDEADYWNGYYDGLGEEYSLNC